MPTIYDIGDAPTITATITDLAGDAADPTACTVTYLTPAGVETAGGAASSTITGTWTWTFPAALDETGTWRVKFTATGDVVAAEEIAVIVRPTKFT